MMRSKKKRQKKGLPEPEVQGKQQQVPEGKKPIGQIIIDVYSDMDVNVRGFPTEHGVAMMILCNAILKVSDWFVRQKGVNKSNLVIAKPGMSTADIEKMAKGN